MDRGKWDRQDKKYTIVYYKCVYNDCGSRVSQAVSSKSALRSHLKVSPLFYYIHLMS
jgi:hypothetical protein